MCWWLYLERLRWNHHLFGIGYKDFDHSLSFEQSHSKNLFQILLISILQTSIKSESKKFKLEVS